MTIIIIVKEKSKNFDEYEYGKSFENSGER